MDAFATQFGVDDDDYRWYFHGDEDGMNFGGMFFRPPYLRVERMPITPDILIEAIDSKRWPLRYPPHQIPAVRWDIRINQLLVVVPLILLGLWLWARLVA